MEFLGGVGDGILTGIAVRFKPEHAKAARAAPNLWLARMGSLPAISFGLEASWAFKRNEP
jgi:hypothetical protein